VKRECKRGVTVVTVKASTKNLQPQIYTWQKVIIVLLSVVVVVVIGVCECV